MPLSEQHDLRNGNPAWDEEEYSIPPSTPPPPYCDVAIIGAGIMGAVLAERLSADGHKVALLDRRPPAHGSTAASTAQIMWAMDLPMRDLAARLGEAEARRRWQRVYKAIRAFAARIDDIGIACHRADRPTLYLEGNTLDARGLAEEAAFHARAGLPTDLLAADAIATRFGIAPRAGLVSMGGFELDPVALTLGLLNRAIDRGARVCWPCDVVALETDKNAVALTLENGGRIGARHAIFAGGYERAPLLLPPAFKLLSTFVIATPPRTAPLWREHAMIWEASDPYLYLRTSRDGRIIVGGEDIDAFDPVRRDRETSERTSIIAQKAAALLGLDDPLSVDRRWAAMFGSSPDGLPAIGPAANLPGVWLSAGFGGNGIAFAALASEILTAALSGRSDPDAVCFDPYRFP
ncbi:NAD(P)/FAD-dependent oxidoreductase [Sphingomonas koreensis]